MIDIYEVWVGTIGATWNGNDLEQAEHEFDSCVKASKDNIGRAGGQSVTLYKNDGTLKQYVPPVAILSETAVDQAFKEFHVLVCRLESALSPEQYDEFMRRVKAAAEDELSVKTLPPTDTAGSRPLALDNGEARMNRPHFERWVGNSEECEDAVEAADRGDELSAIQFLLDAGDHNLDDYIERREAFDKARQYVEHVCGKTLAVLAEENGFDVPQKHQPSSDTPSP